ncbi:uncharacterized protein K452DRAFT_357368 [Aplosporella prunicola CBS 121167]|uniref:DNA polymerase delta subunit 4 n=1 Tax=Aplosporella prunicola CBS 121167 TaxID=1176127 RepID=A0A6A6BK28_9PEZI|nr:uncharacterized protein K452DRAFT_357368 [Aplosporella prunicola CBS 121167]KAF2143743.1 hypothetical protein K452DRAFT_357368 [Aplosporella prunicola CBS 121167]
MPPKRPAPGSQAGKSQQSTLAFHGAANKVTKPRSTPAGKGNKSKQDPILSEPVTQTNLKVEADPELSEPTTSELAITQQAQKEAAKEPTKEEQEASRVTIAQIKKYWKAKEALRKAPRVHQEDLTLQEKVLREFDTSGQYGPCIGIAREKRWYRAHKFKKHPPIEVLAVILREKKNKPGVQRAYMDELMSSRFIET